MNVNARIHAGVTVTAMPVWHITVRMDQGQTAGKTPQKKRNNSQAFSKTRLVLEKSLFKLLFLLLKTQRCACFLASCKLH